jgi:hypothetical protein
MRRAGWRLRAARGVIGPAAFTAAWVTSTVRQTGYSIAEEHLSSAPAARGELGDPRPTPWPGRGTAAAGPEPARARGPPGPGA